MNAPTPFSPEYRRWVAQQVDLLETRWAKQAAAYWARRDAEKKA